VFAHTQLTNTHATSSGCMVPTESAQFQSKFPINCHLDSVALLSRCIPYIWGQG
jgi:hypothetical protein